MTTLQYSSEIIDWALFKAGEPTDGTSDFQDDTLRGLNRAYRAIWMGGGEFVKDMNEPWLWLKKDPPGTLILKPIKNSGTVNVANNSATATLSAVVAEDLDGWFLKVAGCPDVFRVSAHTAGSATLTLDSVYTGTDNTTASYTLMKLEYDLAADCLRVIAPMRCQSDNRAEIEGIDLPALDRDYPLLDIETGTPERFALVTETKVRFNRAGGTTSTDLRRVEYDYLRKPDDLTDSASEEPAVPLQHRQVLADATLFYLLQSKSDQRVEQVGLQVNAGLKAMSADNRARTAQMGHGFAQLRPRLGNTLRFTRVPRTSSGLVIG